MTPVFRMLIGNHVPAFSDLLEQLVRRRLMPRYKVECTCCISSDEMIKLAAEREFRLFVLIANNLFTPPDTGPGISGRLDVIIDLVAHLKSTYRRPVVALSGYWIPGLSHRLEAAGADIILSLPFEPEHLGELLDLCVE